MGTPSQSVTLTADQVDAIKRQLGILRHDVNNHLSLVRAALEMIRYKPDTTERMLSTVAEQPPKINATVVKFSAELEQLLGKSHD